MVLLAFPGFYGYTRLYAYVLRFGLKITEKRKFTAFTFWVGLISVIFSSSIQIPAKLIISFFSLQLNRI